MSTFLVTEATVLPMTEARQSFVGYVRVRDGIIREIGAGAPKRDAVGGSVIDGTGCALMPGLINAHTHLYQVLLRAVWEERRA